MLKGLVDQLNMYFSALGVSHLFLSPPVQSNEILFHKVTDTGIRVRLVEGSFIITDFIKGSSATQLDLKLGDEILGINGYELRYPDDVRRNGIFTVQRGDKTFDLEVKGSELHIDQRPFVYELNKQIGVLRIPSFEGQYKGVGLFEASYWRSQVKELHKYKKIIIDLRGNYGGNFAAMLRAASAFFCKPTLIGSIRQPRRTELEPKSYFPDVLDGMRQLATLDTYQEVELITYDGYNCYEKPVQLLVDSTTASVAEIFAAGMKLRKNSIVSGNPTSGSVLVARREELLRLGIGYVLNIPIATYYSVKGEALESEGLYPDLIFHYELATERSGKDSWLLEAQKHF